MYMKLLFMKIDTEITMVIMEYKSLSIISTGITLF